MADQSKQRGLGKGLQALLGEATGAGVSQAPASGKDGATDKARGMRDLPIEFLHPNPDQPRRTFNDADLEDLAQSIRERGVLQPIIARPRKNDPNAFEIVAGERRWRAAQKAQRHTVPVIVKELTDSEVLEIGLVENVQRADLNALEEAAGYQTLIQKFKYTQEQLSKLICKSRSHVANMMRLLSLPDEVQGLVTDGKLSAGHARALVGSDDAGRYAQEIVSKGLNVRQTEALVSKTADEAGQIASGSSRTHADKKTVKFAVTQKDPDTLDLERKVSNALGLPVSIDFRGGEGGDVRISYTSLAQLDDICRRLGKSPATASSTA